MLDWGSDVDDAVDDDGDDDYDDNNKGDDDDELLLRWTSVKWTKLCQHNPM